MIRPELRNFAIIAHVDHGKTTLVDAMLAQTGIFRENQAVVDCFLDSNDLERERGITILSKNIAIEYQGIKINLIDTPGHSDFGGEVERVLKLADGVLLLVDSFEGPMPQTRFVLQKAMELHLKPVVVVNKMDRKDARPLEVMEEVSNLILELAVDDAQLEFPVVYASGREGKSGLTPDSMTPDLRPLLDTMLEAVNGPDVEVDAPMQFLVASFEVNDFVGRIAIGRVVRGTVRTDQPVALIRPDGRVERRRVRKIQLFDGLLRRDAPAAAAGEIAALVGIDGVSIGDCLTAFDCQEALGGITIEQPTISMIFSANDSPTRGQEGQHVTSRKLRERLYREDEADFALQVTDTDSPDAFEIAGRGVLHLGVLVEKLRREGYEFCVSRPRVIYREIDGARCEPIEEAIVELPSDMSGKAMGLFGSRRGELVTMDTRGERLRMEFNVPSRGLIGLRNVLLTATQGEATLFHRFLGYEEDRGPIPARKAGVQVSDRIGTATTYALGSLQERGSQFIGAGAKVYEGMIIGEHCHDRDLVVNVCREKQLTNFRASGSDKAVMMAPPIQFSVEESLEYIAEDELLEVTPQNLRMRKRILDAKQRKRAGDVEKARLEAAAPPR